MSTKAIIKKTLKIVVIVLVVALVVIQFFRIDKTAPPVVQAETLEAAVAVPPDISLILGRSCTDCHSNTTIYPWYTSTQPAGWFMKNHIDSARRQLNFSIFNTYPPKKKANRLEGICDLVTSHEMPLPSYLWIHWDSKLKDTEIKALCDWSKTAEASIDPGT